MSKVEVIVKPMGLFCIAATVGVLAVLAGTRGRATGAETAVPAAAQKAARQEGAAPVVRKPVIPAAGLAPPLLEYRFNDSGTNARNTGRAPGATLALRTENGPADLHSSEGMGVSGRAGDRAFNNTRADSMGSKATSGLGAAITEQPVPQLRNLKTYTLYGWLRTESDRAIANAARIVENRSTQGGGFTVLAASGMSGGIQVDAGGKDQKVLSNPIFRDKDTWVAFAVTVDTARNQAVFYRGDRGGKEGAFYAVNRTFFPAPLQMNGGTFYRLAIGNSEGFENKRPFDGMLDNIRIYDRVLTVEQLEAQRLADLK